MNKACSTTFFSMFLFLVLFSNALANDHEEEYRKSRLKQMKSGDWAEYEISIEIGAPLNSKHGKTRKLTVTAIDGKAVKFKTEDTSSGKTETSESTLAFGDRTKPVDDKGQRQEAEGNEQVIIGDKDYECTWFETENQTELGGQPAEVVDKTWYSDDVPVFGEVKSVFTAKTNTVTTTTETLKKFGRAK